MYAMNLLVATIFLVCVNARHVSWENTLNGVDLDYKHPESVAEVYQNQLSGDLASVRVRRQTQNSHYGKDLDELIKRASLDNRTEKNVNNVNNSFAANVFLNNNISDILNVPNYNTAGSGLNYPYKNDVRDYVNLTSIPLSTYKRYSELANLDVLLSGSGKKIDDKIRLALV